MYDIFVQSISSPGSIVTIIPGTNGMSFSTVLPSCTSIPR